MHHCSHNSQRGMALLMCMFALMLLSAVGLGLMFMSDTETSVNYNYRSSQQGYYASKAGLEELRERMRYGNANSITPPSVMPSSLSSSGVIYIINSDGGTAVQPWSSSNAYFDDELCHENFSGLGLTAVTRDIPCSAAVSGTYYTTVTSTDPNTGTGAAVPYKWVRITLKQNGTSSPYCVDGTCAAGTLTTQVCVDPLTMQEKLLPIGATICESATPPLRSVYLLTSLAVTKTGSRRMTQLEVATTMLPPMPAAITFDGGNPSFYAPDSNSLIVNGDDNHSCGPGGGNFPALGAYDSNAVTTLTNDIPNHRQDNYTGSSGLEPDIQNVGPTGSNVLGPLATVGGLSQLVTNITSVADQVYGNNPSGVNLGTTSAPKVTVVNGDFSMGNSTGAGLLLVTGTMTFSGNPSFSGMILVIGKGAITTGNGGGNGFLNGAMFVANLYDSQGHLISPSTAPPGVPTLNWNGGGTFNVNYDSCWVNNLTDRLVYRIIASREEIY